MDKCIQVKLTSYRLVSQELHRTLEQSKVHFESFTEDAESHGQLNAFTDLIEQINGCLRILRLRAEWEHSTMAKSAVQEKPS